jgi:hypothetical protein
VLGVRGQGLEVKGIRGYESACRVWTYHHASRTRRVVAAETYINYINDVFDALCMMKM